MKTGNQTSGSVLLPVMFVVVLAAITIGAASSLTSEQVLLTSRSADVDALETTSEGVLDYAYGAWKNAMNTATSPLDATASNALVSGGNRPAVPSQMGIVNLTINPVDVNGVVSTATPPPAVVNYKKANVYTYVGSVTLRSSGIGGNRLVTLKRNFVYTQVPPASNLFFSQGNFELYKPAAMTIGGDVHTNSDAHVSTGTSATNVTFQASAQVSYVGKYDNEAPAGATTWNNSGTNYAPTYANGQDNQVKRVSEITGIGQGSAADYDANNPNANGGNRELIEQPVSGSTDPASIASNRLYNTSGLLINVSGPVDTTATLAVSNSNKTYSGGNLTITAQKGTTLTATQAKQIQGAITNATRNASNQLVQTTLYDKRELASVPITNLNVGTLTPTLNALSGFNGSIYIYDSGSTKNAVRVINGGKLPDNGLTVATEGGLYVQGDYNTGTTTDPTAVPANKNPSATAATTTSDYTTKPAALVGDAVMLLSNSWSDSNASNSVSSRSATNTTYNVAFISGYVPSTTSGQNGRSGYSGGMNNFPRLLETWSGESLTLSGAFVSLWKSLKYTGQWDTGDIYVPPARYWSFDKNLLSNVLPGIPASTSLAKGPMTRG